MLFHRSVFRLGRAVLVATMLMALSAATVAAHSQVVTPNGSGAGFGPRPISNPWAQAHCNAASPSLVADSSNGVVQFLPAGALPCPATPNPGGQVHPNAN